MENINYYPQISQYRKNKQIIKQNVEYLNKIIYNLYIIIYKSYNHKIGRRLN